MESEVAGRPRIWESVVAVAWCGGSSYLTATVVVPVLNSSTMDVSYSGLGGLWFVTVWFTMSRMVGGYRVQDAKRSELDALRPVFHERFSASELLSMHECMRVAPRVFWEEYANLASVQVTEAMNRKFRERVAPYVVGHNEITQRTALLVAVFAVFLALFVAVPTVFDLLTGGASLVEWWERMFSVNGDIR